MKIVFRVRYRTVPGQSLWLCLEQADGSVEELPMAWLNMEQWELELETDGLQALNYSYQLREEGNGLKLDEWGERRRVVRAEASRVWLSDTWRSAGAPDEAYVSKALQALLPARGPFKCLPEVPAANHRFSIRVAAVPPGRSLCLTGDDPAMGGWNPQKALRLVEVAANLWEVDLELPADAGIEYKYGFCDSVSGKLLEYEEGENRLLEAHHLGVGQLTWVQDENYRRDPASGFRGAGVAIPVFSLRSDEGLGVGEFADLTAFGEWAHGLGMKLVQILPIHDTTASRDWTDSYPYSAISCFALHPIYLRLDVFREAMPDAWGERLDAEREKLNALYSLDYEAVMKVKLELTREVFDTHYATLSEDDGMENFMAEQQGWLPAYAAFCVLRDQHGSGDFSQWGEDASFSHLRLKAMWEEGSGYRQDMHYWMWLQHELNKQLGAAVAALHERGVVLKGDLPIGIDRCSVEAWSTPELFNLDAQSGAPPDYFSEQGQNWGFPTYNWERMAEDGYAWWQARLSHLALYFDAFRIDHVLGFFRIWQIPIQHVNGLRGWFEPAMPVRLEEFRSCGLDFSYQRFCEPWLTGEALRDMFGERADELTATYLRPKKDGAYEFREAFDTQRKVLEYFGDKEDPICKALLACHGEILFIEVPGSGGTEFHPRYGLQRTRSFADLDHASQEKVDALYIDYFFKRQDFHWRAGGMMKLDALRRASEMLLCGEDLGMVPDCVPGVMRDTGILGLEIQRMPKTFGADFSDPRHAPWMSVVSPSTHDMSNLREWWQAEPNQAKRLAWLQFEQAHPTEELEPEFAAKLVGRQFESPAMWAIIALQDLLALDERLRHSDPAAERINDPAVNPHNWRYRMHLSVAELTTAEALNGRIRALLEQNGRIDPDLGEFSMRNP